MLQEEFVALVQKELGRSCENEAEATCQDVSLAASVSGSGCSSLSTLQGAKCLLDSRLRATPFYCINSLVGHKY
ncbi:unnamed protein product [Toxocara canis]|uniref:PMF1 n=1 Tax=Toxocara canis TaxID=6265 RepID=A0A183U8A2_TOXCA|nr:unnamed protein product [Toxocara canis]